MKIKRNNCCTVAIRTKSIAVPGGEGIACYRLVKTRDDTAEPGKKEVFSLFASLSGSGIKTEQRCVYDFTRSPEFAAAVFGKVERGCVTPLHLRDVVQDETVRSERKINNPRC